MQQQAQTVNTCKNCGGSFTGKYCNACGEKRYTDHDRTIAHFIEEGIHFFTHFEGTFFTTLKYLFTSPGRLSSDYCFGRRKSLFKPMSLFFLLVIIYLLFPVFEGLNMKLYYHVNNDIYGPYAKSRTIAVMQEHGWTEEQMAAAFHQASTKVSKFLLLILLPLTALYFWIFTFRKRPYFFDQMVFATEINSVYLIWGFLLMPLLLTVVQAASKLILHRYLVFTDLGLTLFDYVVLMIYLFIAARRFYGLHAGPAALLSLLFFFAHGLIVQVIYKFILFSISIRLVH